MTAESVALDRLIVTIVAVRRRFDDDLFHRAIAAARVAVAAVVLEESEARAGVGATPEPCVVVRFPKGRRAKGPGRRER